MLPELWEPRVPEVVFRTKFKVVIIKPFHVRRLQLDSNTPGCFLDVAICHIVPVRPAIAAKEQKGREKQKDLASLSIPMSVINVRLKIKTVSHSVIQTV